MGMEYYKNFLDNIKQTPKEYYHDYNQAVVNNRWDDTTQIREVKEQIVTDPFGWSKEYLTFDAWVDNISDMLVNTNKVYSDFIEILPRDIDHPMNYRGQYYKLSPDEDVEETYLCYESISRLRQLPNFKCVRCNNVLTFVNSKGQIVRYPCYLGTDISSTNDYVAKSGIMPNTRMIVLVQVNEDTKELVNNQRLMFEHSSTFEIEEVNNFMQEEGTNGIVTIEKIYVKYSTLLPRDNKELNLCDYYNNESNPIEEDLVNKTLVVKPMNINLRYGKTREIKVNVLDENENIISQDITYEFNWEDDTKYKVDKTDNGISITNIEPSEKPLYITFKSDGCEDITACVWLVYSF